MGTDGGSEADTGRGTHRRSRLPTPHLAHLAPPHSQQLLRKNKNFAFFGGFWRAELAGWLRMGAPDGPLRRAITRRDGALIAQ